jgi:tellurite methyltransferase
MKRAIVGYHKDELEDWVAELDCHHNQHVRHKPPFTNRPWVETLEGRTEKLGCELDCVRCDRFELPESLIPYKRTPDFDESSVPTGLLKEHSTKTGVWGLIQVEEGQLVYTAGAHSETVHAGSTAVVVPNMLHQVAPIGSVKFFVEFHR